MHADRGGVQDGVEKLGAQRGAGHSLSAKCAREFPCGFFAARANGDGSARTYQRKSGRPGRSTRPEDQDAAAFEAKLFLERTKHAEVIGVATIKRTVPANDHGVNGADFRGERIALLQIPGEAFPVRASRADPAQSKVVHRSPRV